MFQALWRVAAAVVLLLAVPAVPAGVAQIAVAVDDLIRDYRWRSIGPGAIGSRVTDIEAIAGNFATAYVATAGGGLWKTVNAGTTWTPIFDRYASSSIGDVALFRLDPSVVWVGTGIGSQTGDGIYKSIDGGDTFRTAGLGNAYQIARVATHPSNPSVVYAAAIGSPQSASGSRGVFATIDGGGTWQRLTNGLPVEARADATDLAVDPAAPDTIYAAFTIPAERPEAVGAGLSAAGVFKSVDAGRTWRRLGGGLPDDERGRISLALAPGNSRVVMAIVEHPPAIRTAGAAIRSAFGATVYRSDDAGESWRRVSHIPERASAIVISPVDEHQFYVLGLDFRESSNAGRRIEIAAAPYRTHGDYTAMWIDPANPDRRYLGSTAGLELTLDGGRTYRYFDNLPIASYASAAVDAGDPYAIYGAIDDNGLFATASFSRDPIGIRNDVVIQLDDGDSRRIAMTPGGSGVVYAPIARGLFVFDPVTRAGATRLLTQDTIRNFREATGVAPGSADALAEVRVDAASSLLVSMHDPSAVFVGGTRLLRTTDRGASWSIVDRRSDGERAVFVELAESPVTPAVFWAATGDGRVHLSRDGGSTWTDVTPALPNRPAGSFAVRDVAPSAYSADTAYVVCDRRERDDRAPCLFRTTTGGRTWTDLSRGLAPSQPVNVVVESSRNRSLLFAGTAAGVQVSFDAGQRWTPFGGAGGYGMPTVAVQALVIHPRERDLIAATAGRGLYIIDDVSALEAWRPEMATNTATLFVQRTATLWMGRSRAGPEDASTYAGQNPPSIMPLPLIARDGPRLQTAPIITFAMGWGVSGLGTLAITSPTGDERLLAVPARPGITRYRWDGRLGPAGMLDRSAGTFAAGVGDYRLTLTVGGRAVTGTLTLRGDPSK
ncbi:MAG TPA: hypothetical protein VFO19_18715 [Vicinamibacterales bacterium]|nr:hypothetical protein [Vicinamibacterales bacterium]